ncbi:hypothetical protein [Polynucleobacter alcilacus]|uniref:hypothetical protein n=1 Tax=Polynucleobacter alcilacus TaxID=1819739 RepID=UPI001C0B8A7A|nr:hypothetical protein [Polynucleobacter alcilacus]MBU3566582.1 hypothetical protein [Polynucleobacter alcilacus]
MAVKKPKTSPAPKPASRAGAPSQAKDALVKSATNSPLKKISKAMPEVFAKAKASPSPVPAASKDKQLSKAAKATKPAGKVAVKSAVKPATKSGKASAKPSAANGASLNGKGLPEAAIENLPKTNPKLEQKLAKQTVGSARSSLKIFQIYYENWQRELLDSNFIGLDNGKSDSELLEFAVFDRLAKSEHIKDAQLWGALSWRFTEKTGMSGADLVKNIQDHPGHDVYFCNPFPHNEALFHNLWLQGETTHPQFMALSKAVFQATGLPVAELTNIHTSDQFSAANYFVGTPKFWSLYLPWINNVLSTANKKLPSKVRDLLHSKQADERGIHHGATYVPFIVERLFPIFMKTAGKSLKAYKIALPERERELNVHLKLLREMKDVAHRTKSAWMAVCWANYRNLYLTQVSGKEWSKKYLRALTPTEVNFS